MIHDIFRRNFNFVKNHTVAIWKPLCSTVQIAIFIAFFSSAVGWPCKDESFEDYRFVSEFFQSGDFWTLTSWVEHDPFACCKGHVQLLWRLSCILCDFVNKCEMPEFFVLVQELLFCFELGYHYIMFVNWSTREREHTFENHVDCTPIMFGIFITPALHCSKLADYTWAVKKTPLGWFYDMYYPLPQGDWNSPLLKWCWIDSPPCHPRGKWGKIQRLLDIVPETIHEKCLEPWSPWPTGKTSRDGWWEYSRIFWVYPYPCPNFWCRSNDIQHF